MTDYDKYLVSSVHKLYEDVVFWMTKHQTDKITYTVVNVLRREISDILVYILNIRPSAVSALVARYVVVFATHILYPLIPTTSFALLQHLGMRRTKNFFEQSMVFDVDKNIKCNFLMQFVTQWYREAKQDHTIAGFVLRANTDFVSYAQHILPDFYDFLGSEYTLKYLTERDERPEDVEAHKVFAMERGVLRHERETPQSSGVELEESLAMLNKKLSYKQQLMQTLRNTLMRARTA